MTDNLNSLEIPDLVRLILNLQKQLKELQTQVILLSKRVTQLENP